MKKLLTVHLASGIRRTFNEHLDEWESMQIQDGWLKISRPDGTTVFYASGSWVSTETTLVEAP